MHAHPTKLPDYAPVAAAEPDAAALPPEPPAAAEPVPAAEPLPVVAADDDAAAEEPAQANKHIVLALVMLHREQLAAFCNQLLCYIQVMHLADFGNLL